MWIVFGWQKEEKPLADVGSGYCYDCRRQTTWVVWNESEWVTFSAIRTLRFVNRNRLHCESCVFRRLSNWLARRRCSSSSFATRWRPSGSIRSAWRKISAETNDVYRPFGWKLSGEHSP